MSLEYFRNKNLIWLGIGILIIVAGLVAYYKYSDKFPGMIGGIESREFQGAIQKVEANKIYLKGSYIVSDSEKAKIKDQEIVNKLYDVAVEVTPETKFVKTIWYMLSMKELEKTGGAWNPDDLKKDIQEGSFEDLKNVQGLALKVTTAENIFGEKDFKAITASYVVSVYPQE